MSSQSKAARKSTATSRVNRGDNTLLYYARAYAGRGLVLDVPCRVTGWGRRRQRDGNRRRRIERAFPTMKVDANSKATHGINAKARSVRAGAVERRPT